MRYLFLLLLLPCLTATNSAANTLALTEHGHYYVDAQHELTLPHVIQLKESAWRPIRRELSLGLINDTIWVRLPLPPEKQLLKDQSGILALSNPLLNRVSVYLVDGTEPIAATELGDWVTIDRKNIAVADIYWLLPDGWEQATHAYIKIRSDSFFQSYFKILSVPDLVTHHGQRYWFLGLFYGALTIMLFYNLFVFFQVRDIRYLYYTGYVFAVGMFYAVMDGLTYYYLSSYYSLFADRMSVYFLALANIFGLLFVGKFLEIRDKRLLRGMRSQIGIFVVAMLVEMIDQGHFSTRFSMVMTIVTSLTISYVTIRSWLTGVVQARYLALAWIALLVSIPIYCLALMGLIPHNLYTLNSVRIGVVLELALISFSLAHRINILRQERLTLQRRLNKELGALVEERTLELEVANKKLQELSETDSLTQIKNRAFFDRVIEEENARAQRNQDSLAVLLLDLDHFKQVNDEYGHTAGDYCLRHFAKILTEHLTRTTDTACRYGGEEFAAILPHTDIHGALNVAERIRHGVEATTFIFEGEAIPLTVSIGVYALVPTADWNSSDWIVKADKALYFAKTQRNRVAFVDESYETQFASAAR